MRRLTPSEREALREVSRALGCDPLSLAALIEFESRWNPRAKNPTSSARGLIQFMDFTAMHMGYSGPESKNRTKGASLALVEAHPTVEAQLRGPVREYLSYYAPFVDRPPALVGQSLYLAVFYPRARSWHPDRTFPPQVIDANPGILTPGHYVGHVLRRAGEITLEDIT